MEKQKKILVAADAETRDFFSVMFEKLGYAVETAADGHSAFQKTKRTVPDLIMASTILPKLSGWEFLSWVKEDKSLKMIPFVLLSDIADVKDMVNAFELGAEEYICSPFSFPVVLARIRSLLRMRELFKQIIARELRLSLAETFHNDLKEAIALFLKNIDNLDEVVALTQKDVIDEETMSQIIGSIREKIGSVRSDAVAIDARISNTIYKWNEFKKKEIAISVFENGEGM